MVGIVTNAGLGLDTSSEKVFAAVGQQGGVIGNQTFGLYGENVTVDAATGNLMVDRTDEILIGQGLNDVIAHGYNSQAQSPNVGYDAFHNWQFSTSRAVVNLSTAYAVNTTGSTVTWIDSDGSNLNFAYSSSAHGYVCQEPQGGQYLLTYDTGSGHWTLTDAKKDIKEVYDGNNGGRLFSTSDNYGNSLTYNYDPTSGLLDNVTTADGEETIFNYVSGGTQVQSITTQLSGGATLTGTYYTYDTRGRLKTVVTDLTPADNTLGSDQVKTTYSYDGASDRITKIAQTGGATINIVYEVLSSGAYAVQTVTQTMNSTLGTVQTYNFSYGAGSTSVTDINGNTTTLNFDSADNLTSVQYPAADTSSASQIWAYQYTANGDLKNVTDPYSNVVGKWTYDNHDNVLTAKDYYGNTTTYTYDSADHLIQANYSPGAGQLGTASVVRYVYNSKESLEYVIDNEGRVTQYQYDTLLGNRTFAIAYAADTYPVSGMAPTDTLSESQMTAWLATLSNLGTTTRRTDYTYDIRGNVLTETSYSMDTATGTGDGSQTKTIVNTVYDQFGQLKSRYTTGATTNAEQWLYDGLGRVIQFTALDGSVTVTQYSDGGDTSTVTFANGLVKMSVWDQSGNVLSVTQSSTTLPVETTKYQYDVNGQLSVATEPLTADNPSGISTYYLYDNLGRKTAAIAADGSMTEYKYDQDNRLVATVSYATKLTSTQLSGLISAGVPTNTPVASLRPTANSADVWNWRIYDADSRLIETADGDGDVTTFVYDNMSNLISTTSFYNQLSPATVSGFKAILPTSLTTPTPSSTQDDTSYTYYDGEGRVIGTQDGDGNLTQIVYDGAGEKTETIAYANRVAAAHRTDGFQTLLTEVAASTSDIRTHYYYDDRGLLTYSLNGVLDVTQYVYDAGARLVQTLTYANPIAAAGSDAGYTLSYIQSQVALQSGYAQNRVSWNVYDPTNGNLDYTIDASGMVTGYVYDNMGNVVEQTQYADIYSPATLPSLSDIAANVTPQPLHDRTTRMVYDSAGNLRFVIDAESNVTENRYDASGRMTLSIRYASDCTLTGIPTETLMNSWASGTGLTGAEQTAYHYDADGRLMDTIADAGNLAIDTNTTYDALGRVSMVTEASGTADQVQTLYQYDTANRLLSVTRGYGTSDASTTYTSYDGQGNVATTTDGDGNATSYIYDTAGNMVSKADALSNTTSYTYDAFGNVIKTVDPLGHPSYAWYDAMNRVILQADQGGYLTATTYTIGGAVASVTRYAQSVTVDGAGDMPTPVPNALDATTAFTRDKLDRVTKVTDAEGYFESYTLDAFGNRVQIFAKSSTAAKVAGGETDDAYDRLGELTKQTVLQSAYKGDGTLDQTSIVDTYTYDDFGNLKTKVEASNDAEKRTTTYTYDGLNRLTSVSGDAVTVVSDSNVNTVTTGFTPTTSYVYDRRGNVIQTTDPAGAVTLSYYDHLDRKIAQVDALGDYSAWTYDDNGNMLTARTYTTPITLPSTPGGAPPSPLNPTQYRQTAYAYDAINRLTTTTMAALLTGAWNGTGYATTTGSVTTTNVYDKPINALHQIDGNGNNTWIYYNALGQKVAEVDADNFLTLYTPDGNGNVTQETRLAKAYTGTMSDTTTYATLQSWGTNAANLDSAHDRTTNFGYDRNGNRTQEVRLNVVAYTVDSSGVLHSTTSTSSTINYTYNGLGEVLSKTEATGDATAYTYDGAGRQTAIDETAVIAGVTTTELHTVQEYDGLGDLVYTDAYSPAAPTVQRKTQYFYGAGGRLDHVIDPDNFTRTFSYDAVGRTVLASYARQHSDGTTANEADVSLYDALGRGVSQGTATKSGSTWSLNDMQGATYDAFGEVTAKSINGIVQQTFAYDNGGRMWQSTDEGVVTLYLYDKNGNQTLAVTTDGNALASGSWSTFTESGSTSYVTAMGTIGVTSPQGMVETITAYDGRNQATQVLEPNRQIAGNATAGYTTASANTAKSYNAFGEVVSETDADGNTTTYSYNTMGKVIQEMLPAVSYTDASGTTHTSVHPTLNNFYDLSGRVVGVEDANGNTNTLLLLAGTGYEGAQALATDEFHADNGHVANTYDAFGDVTETTDAAGDVTDTTYDGDGNVLTVTHPFSGDGVTRLVDHYTYDGLGQRLTHWNSELGSGTVETTDYDAEGRVTQTVDYEGHATTIGYVWTPTLATTGLGTYGGWAKTTTNTAALSMTDDTDVDGREIGQVDFGGHTLTYTYNQAGWLVERDNTYKLGTSIGGAVASGEVLTYSYFNTGEKGEQVSDYNYVVSHGTGPDQEYDTDNDKLTSDYAYDANGNELFEDQIHELVDGYMLTDTKTLTEYETATFDAMNRISSMTDQGVTMSGVTNGVDDPVAITIKYDLAGNVRERVATYYALNNDGSVSTTMSTQKDWYTYDAMNRFIIVKGTLDTTTHTIGAGTNGTSFTYDHAGERKTATSASETDTYTYSDDGYLTETDIALTAGGTEKSTSQFDLMGRLQHYKEYNTSSTVVYSKDETYGALGEDLTDTVYSNEGGSNGAWTYVTTYDYNLLSGSTYTGQYQGGSVVHDHVHTTVTGGPTAPPDTDSNFLYQWFGSAQEYMESYLPVGGSYWYSYLTYDPRENLMEANIHDGQARDVFYDENANGQITLRDTGVETGNYGYSNITGPHARYYYYGGIEMGDVSNDGTSDVNYATAITDHTAKPGLGLFQNGKTTGTKYADFDAAYDPINGLTYEDAPTQYTVQSGDTLESIAQRVWGDSNFWYLLADANGLSGADASLAAGQTLIIPDKVANNQNNSSTYRVYNPNDAIGNISPTTPPKPQKADNCGVFGQIFEAIIAVFVALALPEASGFFGGFWGGMAAAGVGDAVAQGVGLAMGIQKSFNWDELGLSIIGGGVGYEVGPKGLDLFDGLDDTIGDIGVQALQGATASMLTQGIGVATGLQKSFNWAQVAAAGVSAGVGEAVGEWAEGTDLSDGAADALKNTAALIAGAATRTLITGKDFGDNIIADLPDTIGQTIGDIEGEEVEEAPIAQQQAQYQQDTQNYINSPIPMTPISASDILASAANLPVPDLSGYDAQENGSAFLGGGSKLDLLALAASSVTGSNVTLAIGANTLVDGVNALEAVYNTYFGASTQAELEESPGFSPLDSPTIDTTVLRGAAAAEGGTGLAVAAGGSLALEAAGSILFGPGLAFLALSRAAGTYANLTNGDPITPFLHIPFTLPETPMAQANTLISTPGALNGVEIRNQDEADLAGNLAASGASPSDIQNALDEFRRNGAFAAFGAWASQVSGPGQWQTVTESMSDRAAAYQAQITGMPANQSYVVNGVKFDGWFGGALIDAKGPGYSNFLDDEGEWQAWANAPSSLLAQAQSQVAAAPDTPIVWYVAEPDAAAAIQKTIGNTGVKVVYVPPR